MEYLILIAVGAALVVVFRRVAALESALGELRDELAQRSAAPIEEPPEPAVSLRREAVSVPSVVLPGAQEPAGSLDEREPVEHQQRDALPATGTPRFRFDFEDIFGRRLPIWAGGVTLAVAGVFLVRYAIEAGLLTPAVRVALAFLFGVLLLAGAEAAYRYESHVRDPRVRQALSGAGLATLYAGFYLAGTQYGLIGQGFAFLGLAAVTAGAIALSFRFGLPSAVLGLVGGFAAPALVGGEEANLPLLALYLGLVTAGLAMSGRRQRRPWMGLAALVGGLGWGALLLFAGDPGGEGVLALGLYLIVLGAAVPALTGADRFDKPLRLASALVASLQLAILVEQGGFAPLAWALYLLLGAALAFFGWRRPELRETNGVAAAIGVLLLAQWDAPGPLRFAVVAAGLAAVFAVVPLVLIWRREDRDIDLYQLCGTALGLAAVAYLAFGSFGEDLFEPLIALATLALASLPLAAARMVRRGERARDHAVAPASGAALVLAALLMLTPGWAAPLMGGLVFAALFVLLRESGDRAGRIALWGAALVTAVALFFASMAENETMRLFGADEEAGVLRSTLRWAAAALPFAALAWIESRETARRVAESLAALFAYGVLAQVLPQDLLAWGAASMALALYAVARGRYAALATAAGSALLWALGPLAQWLGAGLESLYGDPVLVNELPGWRAALLRVLPVAAALAVIRLPAPAPIRWLAAPLLLVAVHLLYKQVFAIETITGFVAHGMAERTLWEGVLLACAWLADRGLPRLGRQRELAIGLAAAALLHFLVYSFLLHNPLWERQAVGATPLANWILASHAVAILAALLLRQWLGERWRVALDAAVMAIVGLGGLALLRQLFAGAVPADAPLGQAEDLLRSLLGIVLALGFLFLGSRMGERSWRVGSLVLMLVAVAKVFLFDAAGLEGLARIASFAALGFSLIGIGWVYSRQLLARPEPGPG